MQAITRRNLLKSAAVGAGAVVAAGMAATSAQADEAEADDAQETAASWDAEYDVVVIGFGLAGAASAVAAADAGADVLIVDKAPLNQEGGNSRYCAQLCLSPDPDDRDLAITYYQGLRGLYSDQSDEVIEAIVDGLSGNEQWLLDHGADADSIIAMQFPEYPEYEGSEAARAIVYKGSWMSQLYKFMHALVLSYDNIAFWSSSPAVDLVQDKDTGIVTGVVIEHDDEQYRLRAVNGVVMALGGFECNQAMLQNYVQQPGAHSKGSLYNTGDGVGMAIRVGADLWHMSALSGADVNFINPLTGNAAGYALTSSEVTGYCTGFTRYNAIIVGGDGSRFMNEAYFPRHGHVSYGGTYRSLLVPDNAWCIFDETARTTAKAYWYWSDGMTEEIESGYILQADTLEELAELCGIDAEGLVESVAFYNECCANGVDVVYGRDAEYLNPVETAPFYAFEVRPTNTNTQGGARRNTACEVVDTNGEAIPHLYSAGEFGSFYCDIYNGGGNVGECIFTGQLAGSAAAAAKDDVDQASALTSEQTIDFTETRPTYEPEGDDEYIGVGDGMGGDLVVRVTMDGDEMTAIDVLYNNETPGIGSKAITELVAAMIEQQATVVDTFTGATLTSYALMNAVNDALGTGIVVEDETTVEELQATAAASVDQLDE